MIEIGKYHTLEIVKKVDFGIYLDGLEYGEILLPERYVNKTHKPGDRIEVFIYRDSEDRIIATTEQPKAQVGEFAFLKILSITTVGAFLDWGLPKDLLMPYSEQSDKMGKNKYYMVHILTDKKTDRIIASAKIHKFLDNIPPKYQVNQEVNIVVAGKTDIAYRCIINNMHTGLLYQNEVFHKLKQGQKLKAFIKKVRDDEKIDLSLEKQGFINKEDIAERLLDYINKHSGFISITDKTAPDVIYNELQMSKRNFKQAVGVLYKNRIIKLENEGIRLIPIE